MDWKGKEILITGGTGSLGSTLVHKILDRLPDVKGIRVYSRDELKQVELKSTVKGKPVSFLIGDIRDRLRLLRAMHGCDIVIHTAALKHVPVAEDNPMEYIKTNVQGTANVIECCLDCDVERAIFISTDKAVYPVNLYGATKMTAERLWLQADVYAPNRSPIFSACRYGNVIGSRGSAVKVFAEQAKNESGQLTITDYEMTRFWITLNQASNFILKSITEMSGGEVFIPIMPSMKIVDFARVIAAANNCYCPELIEVGIRPGEKLHESMITFEESTATVRSADGYIILKNYNNESKPFTWTSENNDWWLHPSECKSMLRQT
jgi:UDP-N-acetylglucosamine 4,6-dehydratase